MGEFAERQVTRFKGNYCFPQPVWRNQFSPNVCPKTHFAILSNFFLLAYTEAIFTYSWSLFIAIVYIDGDDNDENVDTCLFEGYNILPMCVRCSLW